MLRGQKVETTSPASIEDGTGSSAQEDAALSAQNFDDTLREIPLVRIREDPDGGLRLIETGTADYLPDSAIRRKYGVRPQLLRDFHISGDSMVDTIRPGDRVRAVLWDCRSPNDGTIIILRTPISLCVRRIRIREGEVILAADNPDIPNETIPYDRWEDHYEPVARILEVCHTL